MTNSTHKLGEYLVQRGLIVPMELELALMEQKTSRKLLGELLLDLNLLDEVRLTPVLAEFLNVEAPDLTHIRPLPSTLELLPLNFIRSHQCLPLDPQKGQHSPPILRVVLSQPQNLFFQDQIRRNLSSASGYTIQFCLAGKRALAHAIEQSLGVNPHDLTTTLHRIEAAPEALYEEQAAITLVDELLADAIDLGASDIHFEPDLFLLRIRLRIDGLLQNHHILRIHLWPALLVRLKLLSDMDISTTRQPQDGRMTREQSGRVIDVRAATLPTLHGEHLVLRLLDRQRGIRPLSALGLDAPQLVQLRKLLTTPEGLLLVTGPTGSGKTTTLYAMLHELQDPGRLIMTLEDPVEYTLPGIRQTNIDPPRLDFSSGIRAMLRQDPDIMLIGEIRDEDTASMALRAAQTGHQVFSTLHAGNPFAALPRLQQLGIALTALRGSLIGILSQRLIRRLCSTCKQPEPATEKTASALGISLEHLQRATLFAPAGCPDCLNRGYRGQLLLVEILPIVPEMDDLLSDHAPLEHQQARYLARKSGWQSLAEHGRQQVLKGTTSFQELARCVPLHFPPNFPQESHA